jgi:fluoride exporter
VPVAMARLAEVLAVGAAGSLGAVCRLLVGPLVQRWTGDPSFPLGTLVVNVSGSFALGWFLAYAARRGNVSDAARLAVAVGFLGAYTTFSTLAYDSDAMFRSGQTGRAALNLLGSLVLGLAAVRLGLVLGR